MRMMSIASGSSGNCIYVGTESTHILIDDGVSKKKVLEGLNKLDLKVEDINAVLITHEHDDHIGGLGVFERHSVTPVYGTEKVVGYIRNCSKLGSIPEGIYHSFKAGDTFKIRDIEITTTSISHDAADPVAYVLSDGRKKAGVITDLGQYDERIIDSFSNLNCMLIEANHDINMLMTGRYPYYLKQRILGTRGHLSNESCGKLLSELLNDNIEHLLLGHLSKENNFPELAYETVKNEINIADNYHKADDFDIQVAARDRASDIIIF